MQKTNASSRFIKLIKLTRIYMNQTASSAKRNTSLVQAPSSRAVLAHLPGIIALNLNPPATFELRSWGRTMALFKKEKQDKYLVESIHAESNRSKHLKFIRKNARYLMEIFPSENDHIEHTSGDHTIFIPHSESVHHMVSAEVRSEVYTPMAIFHKKKLVGGAYAYIWRCCSAEQAKKTPPRTIECAPITSIVTGMCMFGTNIMGIDQHGKKHPLTNTFYTMPEGACIECIEIDRAGLHPYEQMMLREFDLQLPMIKALGNGLTQKIFYQCAHYEYVLYGINAYIRGEMTLRALHVYTRYVSERTHLIRDAISRSCERHGFEFDGGQSTLNCLFNTSTMPDELNPEKWCAHFIMTQGIRPEEISSDMPMDKRLDISRKVFHSCIDMLSSRPGMVGEVWRHIREKILMDQREAESKFDTSSLLTLNFINYAAKVAVVKGNTPKSNLCLFHPFQEKAMALAYKDLHAERFGEILAINWIPPIFSHGSFKDGLYYLNEHKDVLNQLIDEGLLEFCALETGAEAMGDSIKAQLARNHIFDLLAKVGEYMAPVSPQNNAMPSKQFHADNSLADRMSPAF